MLLSPTASNVVSSCCHCVGTHVTNLNFVVNFGTRVTIFLTDLMLVSPEISQILLSNISPLFFLLILVLMSPNISANALVISNLLFSSSKQAFFIIFLAKIGNFHISFLEPAILSNMAEFFAYPTLCFSFEVAICTIMVSSLTNFTK